MYERGNNCTSVNESHICDNTEVTCSYHIIQAGTRRMIALSAVLLAVYCTVYTHNMACIYLGNMSSPLQRHLVNNIHIITQQQITQIIFNGHAITDPGSSDKFTKSQ